MALPTRKAPTAPSTANNASAKTAEAPKSRLPQLPAGGLKERKTYQYFELPEGMTRCTYLVRLARCEEFKNKKNQDTISFNFELLDTDVKTLRLGTEIGTTFPLQGDRAMYFWEEITPAVLALSGAEATTEAMNEFAAEGDANLDEIVNKGALIGSIARLSLRSYLNKEGKERTGKDWMPATDAEIAKYAPAT